jgi:hypothetical protein
MGGKWFMSENGFIISSHFPWPKLNLLLGEYKIIFVSSLWFLVGYRP